MQLHRLRRRRRRRRQKTAHIVVFVYILFDRVNKCELLFWQRTNFSRILHSPTFNIYITKRFTPPPARKKEKTDYITDPDRNTTGNFIT